MMMMLPPNYSYKPRWRHCLMWYSLHKWGPMLLRQRCYIPYTLDLFGVERAGDGAGWYLPSLPALGDCGTDLITVYAYAQCSLEQSKHTP